MAHESICIVEDDGDIAELVSYNLERERYAVSVISSGEEALRQIAISTPDLVILDLMLPGVDGLEVCRRLRQDEKTRAVPILMLTAKSEDSDVVAGLELGADDYVTKPFSPRVLVARVRALLRRDRSGSGDKLPEAINILGIDINVPRHEVKCNDVPVDLSATEFAILVLLAGNPGRVYSRRNIISSVKGDDYPVTDRAVDVQILGLRKKLGDPGDFIETIRGFGYRFRDAV